MSTSKQLLRNVVLVLFCVLMLLSFSTGSAQAADKSSYSYSYSYSFSWSWSGSIFDYFDDWGHGRGNAYGQNGAYQEAVAYFEDWVPEARALGINVKMNEMKKICKELTPKNDRYAFIEELVDWTNDEIDDLVAKAQRSRKNDVALLLEQEAFLVDNVMYWADRTGAEVICEYITYIVDGQEVLIDPLRVTRR